MGSGSSSGVMVGRERALEEIDGLLAGPPAVALVSGEAGIGKSRLLRAAEERAEGFVVLHGEALELGGEELAYGPLVAAFRDRVEWPREPGSQARLFELLLAALAGAGRVLLVLEDVHWADRSTLAFLAFLARNPRVTTVASHRDDDLSEETRRVLGEIGRRARRIALAPLTREQVALQLEAIAGGPVPAALAAELHARAGGNPFFVEELYAAGGVPRSIADAVTLRVAALTPAAAHAVRLVAAAGGRADYALLDDADAVHAALDARLLTRDDRGVAFRHGLIGEVVYDRLLPAERTALHRELAEALPADAPAALRALQCARAGLREQALAASLAAGLDAARAHAFAEAGPHFERALDLWDPAATLPLDHVALLAHAAQAARFSGDQERALARCREAIAETADPVRAALLWERLGEYHYFDDHKALECYERALALLGPAPSPERSRLLAAEGHALMGLRRWDEARARCEAALDAGAGPRITLAVVLAFLGEPEAGETYAREALALAETAEETVRAHLHLGELQRVRGDHEAALATMIEGERIAAREGLRGSFGAFMYVNAAGDLLRLGRWDEAAARLAVAERDDLSVTARALRCATAGMLHALRGDTAAAHAALAAAPADPLPSEFVAPLGAARAALALVEGDPAAAREAAEAALREVGDAHDPLYVPELFSLAARAEAGVPRSALLERLDAVLALAAPEPALAHRALVHAELTGDGWDEAARAFEALRQPYPAAYARLRAAEAALPHDRATATAALSVAYATAVSLGAEPLRREAEALARRARLSIVHAPSASAGSPAGLTGREAEVLRALADGLTNREIAARLYISSKTVAAHLAHIFSKLDVHTRVEAAGRAQRLGLLEPHHGGGAATHGGDRSAPERGVGRP